MLSGWQYRSASIAGTAILTAVAVTVANHAAVQRAFVSLPVVGQLRPTVLTNGELTIALLTTLAILLVAITPLFKPQPRRILDTISETQKRVLVATVTLAAIGYFDYTYRLPRTTLLLTAAILLVVLPLYLVVIRSRPSAPSRGLLIGDDPVAMDSILQASDIPIVGYVAPRNTAGVKALIDTEIARTQTDGGHRTPRLSNLEYLGGLSRIREVVLEYDVDTVLLAFSHADRSEFFGALAVCYRHGVSAKVHRDHNDSVLADPMSDEELVDIQLEPWDLQDHVLKRFFDMVFALTGLLVLSPVIALISLAIKLDSPGPVLYAQTRTAEFGNTFTIYKFRSMVPRAEHQTGAQLSAEDRGEVDPRVTRVGRFLRRTHLDEIPQLLSILTGKMSVVGPRPERPELDTDMEQDTTEWQRRWFVKPGLTGLAQIRGATGHHPEQKLRYDIEYIRNQSFWFDLKVIVRQLWIVLTDAKKTLQDR